MIFVKKKVPRPQFSGQKNYAKKRVFRDIWGSTPHHKISVFYDSVYDTRKTNSMYAGRDGRDKSHVSSQHLKICTFDSLLNKKIPNANTLVMHNFFDSKGMKNISF